MPIQCRNKNFEHLYSFVSELVPSNRAALIPGIHWVWNSLRKKVKLPMLIILSDHVGDCQYINCRTNEESLLSNYHNFLVHQLWPQLRTVMGRIYYSILEGKISSDLGQLLLEW